MRRLAERITRRQPIRKLRRIPTKPGYKGSPGPVLPVIQSIQASGVARLDGLAGALNAGGMPRARGGTWHGMTVCNVLARGAGQ